MKIKSMIFVSLFALMSSTFAAQTYTHPSETPSSKSLNGKNAFTPGYCQIEILNYSRQGVTVYGVYDNSLPLNPVNLYSGDAAYIKLYYNGYCHANMWLDIYTTVGTHVYSGYTSPDSTVTVYDLRNAIQAKIQTK